MDCGILARAAPDSQPFAQALGDTLPRIARLLLVLSAFIWLLDRRGVAVGLFGWNEAALAFTARSLRRFTALFVPLVFIAMLNGLEFAPFANRDSLGRVAFIVAMLACAAFLVKILRRKSPLDAAARAQCAAQPGCHLAWALDERPGGIAGRHGGALRRRLLHRCRIYLRADLAVAVRRVRRGDAVRPDRFLGADAALYHLALRQDAQAAQAAQAEAAEAAESEVAEVRLPQQLDVAALGEQTESLLDLLITLLLLGGIWSVWKDALPVLTVIGDYTLWTYTATEGGVEVTRPLTLGNLFLAILVAVVTTVAVRNIGALLDIVLLQRLEVQADATYAIKVMSRYVLAGVGIVLASRILGIAWSDVQWMIAALGVGLGFGLQEIVANFVSGLILLAERPIRIGDVITVGDVSGTVAGIRARATRVIDFDNKEVIIPNKAFIAERVSNWTLSNRTTRLLLRFAVPGGSDISLVQRMVLDAVRVQPRRAAGTAAVGVLRCLARRLSRLRDPRVRRFDGQAAARAARDPPRGRARAARARHRDEESELVMTRPGSPWVRLSIKLLLWSAGLLLVAAVGVILFLKTLDADVYRRALERELSSILGRTVSIGGLSFNVSLIPSLAARDLRIANPPWASRTDFVTAASGQARIDLIALWEGRVELRALHLQGVDLLLERNADGKGNWLLRAPGRDTTAADLPDFDAVSLADARIAWRQGDRSIWQVQVDTAEATIRKGAPFEFRGQLAYRETAMRLAVKADSSLQAALAGKPWHLSVALEPKRASLTLDARLDDQSNRSKAPNCQVRGEGRAPRRMVRRRGTALARMGTVSSVGANTFRAS